MTINVLLVNLNIFCLVAHLWDRKYYVPKFQRYLLYVNFIIGLYVNYRKICSWNNDSS